MNSPIAASEPSLAFDADVYTEWTAFCDGDQDPGCERGEAWIGQMYTQPELVKCIRVHQTGNQRADDVTLGRWNGKAWVDEVIFQGRLSDIFYRIFKITSSCQKNMVFDLVFACRR